MVYTTTHISLMQFFDPIRLHGINNTLPTVTSGCAYRRPSVAQTTIQEHHNFIDSLLGTMRVLSLKIYAVLQIVCLTILTVQYLLQSYQKEFQELTLMSIQWVIRYRESTITKAPPYHMDDVPKLPHWPQPMRKSA